MSAVQPKAPLTLEQAHDILETLSLLNAIAHKSSKLVFYDTKIALEPDSSMWRTINSWTAPVTTSVKYYAGFETETETRDLTALPPLMKRVHQAVLDQKFNSDSFINLRQRLDQVEKAEKGLGSLMGTRYLTKAGKAQLIETAVETVREIKIYYQQKNEASYHRSMEDFKSKGRAEQEARERLMAEKDQELLRLRLRVAELERMGERDAKTDAIWLQIVANATQEVEKKLAAKDLLLAAQALGPPVNLEAVPSNVILERVRVLLDVLAARQPK